MSEITVAAARDAARPSGAVHYFPVGEALSPVCGRLKGAVDAIAETEDEVTCGACRTVFKRGGYTLDAPVDDAPVLELVQEDEEDLDAADEDMESDLEGAEEDEDEEDEKSTTKAQKFAAYAKGFGWEVRVKVGPGTYSRETMTHVYATHGDVSIHMAWEEGRYQYGESRIIKGKGELLNQLIRNASAARGYVFAIHLNEDATRPVLRVAK